MQKVKKAMAVNQTAENKIKTEAGLTEALAYITNPAKISEVSRLNCSGSNSNTLDQFRLLRLAFNQNKGIIAHHFIQSFAPNDNVTPETVHRFGVEYAKLCFPNYQVVVSTHVDKEHLHNHIIVNSCNMITGRKYYDNNKNLLEWQKAGGTSVKAKNNINHKGLHGELWKGELIDVVNGDVYSDICKLANENYYYAYIGENDVEKLKQSGICYHLQMSGDRIIAKVSIAYKPILDNIVNSNAWFCFFNCISRNG